VGLCPVMWDSPCPYIYIYMMLRRKWNGNELNQLCCDDCSHQRWHFSCRHTVLPPVSGCSDATWNGSVFNDNWCLAAPAWIQAATGLHKLELCCHPLWGLEPIRTTGTAVVSCRHVTCPRTSTRAPERRASKLLRSGYWATTSVTPGLYIYL
jgi:hypothetical protein